MLYAHSLSSVRTRGFTRSPWICNQIQHNVCRRRKLDCHSSGSKCRRVAPAFGICKLQQSPYSQQGRRQWGGIHGENITMIATGKSWEQDQTKNAYHNDNAPLRLIVTDMMGPFTPSSFGELTWRANDHHNGWQEVYLLNSKNDDVDSLKYFVHNMVIPAGLRLGDCAPIKGASIVLSILRDIAVTRVLSMLMRERPPVNR